MSSPSTPPLSDWEPVIGLEIHAQLKTATKLFDSDPNHFGDEPNVNIGVVCTGQPGTLPLLNREAVHKAILLGCALNAEIALQSTFDRKSYFYPDSPRNFQITQFYHPIFRGGRIVTEVGGTTKTFYLHHAHLEDDSGMLKHFSSFAGVDDNRAGVPLIEIVSEPCLHSAQDASAYAQAIRTLLEHLEVADCSMEEGGMRMDVNISVRKRGEPTLRTKVEIKNMNSFHNMEQAIQAEIARQIALYEQGSSVRGGTYRFDLEQGQTVLMRDKESAEDYRYFPEPDILPLVLTPEEIAAIRATLPELPSDKFHRYCTQLGLPADQATLLTQEKRLSAYFELALQGASDARNVANWILVEFGGRLKAAGTDLWKLQLPAPHVAELVTLLHRKELTGKAAKAIADLMMDEPATPPKALLERHPEYRTIQDTSAIQALIDEVLASQPQAVADCRNGIKKSFEFLVGQTMARCKGAADPGLVRELLRNRLGL